MIREYLPRPRASAGFAARGVLIGTSASLLASCGDGVLSPQGPVGEAERVILFDATAIMLAVVVPVILLTLGVAWWFRAGNTRAKYLPDWQYSGRIEMVVWSIPVLVVLFLGGIAWVGAHDLDPAMPLASDQKPLEIQVVSLDWKWLFIYPDDHIALVNRLVIPAGRPVHFRLTSQTVMNSFFIPQLGSQIYTMPGMATQLNLLADHPGTYRGLSAQFSGDGFSDMVFDTVVLPTDQFSRWLNGAHGGAKTLDIAAYAGLSKPGSVRDPITFGGVSPGLFEGIAYPERHATTRPGE